jgi:hypothetical protein
VWLADGILSAALCQPLLHATGCTTATVSVTNALFNSILDQLLHALMLLFCGIGSAVATWLSVRAAAVTYGPAALRMHLTMRLLTSVPLCLAASRTAQPFAYTGMLKMGR